MNQEKLLLDYTRMRTIREFEERLHIEIATGEIAGFTHLYSGQEAIAVGVISHMGDEDFIASTHRGHGHCIAKGCDVTAMMKEIYGKRDGLCGGKGGSMHIADISKGMLGANAIVGGGPPIAVGAAIATKIQNQGKITASFTGDGGSNQGTVFEAMNLAVVLKLPSIFIFENNGYGEHTGASYAVGSKDICSRALGFGMPAEKVDGCDYFAVYEAAERAIARARSGEGPSAIEFIATRFFGHYEGDPQSYRVKGEIEEHRRSMDCLVNFREKVISENWLTSQQLEDIDEEIRNQIDKAVHEAKTAPAPNDEDLYTDVYIEY